MHYYIVYSSDKALKLVSDLCKSCKVGQRQALEKCKHQSRQYNQWTLRRPIGSDVQAQIKSNACGILPTLKVYEFIQ